MMHRNREHWSSTVVWRNPLLMGRHCRVLLGTNRYFVGGSSIDWDPAMSTLKSSGPHTYSAAAAGNGDPELGNPNWECFTPLSDPD
ncbi:hypothetical protein Q1695_008114 [Nippostrongylus brasiliensis]|nr:hypothetical protein Q1695_008114 [Nippostrongylus brasiliensis]